MFSMTLTPIPGSNQVFFFVNASPPKPLDIETSDAMVR